MKQVLLFLALQFFVVFAFSQTEIPAGEMTTATWTAAGSPYNINGSITIPSDNTLTIGPGVEIIFKGNYTLTVKGILITQGTENYPVSFTADNYWSGIYVPNVNFSVDSIILDYCTISNSHSCGIRVYAFDKIRISNCHIYNNSKSSGDGGGIYLNGSNAVIKNNFIENNSAIDGGGIYSYGGSPKITDNTFKSNSASGGGGGLDIRYAKTTVANNLFIGNTGSVRGGAIYSVYNTGGYQVLYINNTIVNNTSGSVGGIFSWQSTDKYVNNVLWGNSSGQFGYSSYKPILHHNAIEGGYSLNYDGLELLSENIAPQGPMFTDPENNDFTLQATSPLIEAGTPRGTTIGYTENAPETYYTVSSTLNNSKGGLVWSKYEFVVPDDSVVFSIDVNDHYELTGATYNSVDVSSDLDSDGGTIFYTAKNISQNGTFAVVFSQVLYDVIVSAGANGSITPSDPTTGGIESSLEYIIQPAPGYVADKFKINGVEHLEDLVKSGTSYSFVLDTITEDKNIETGFIYGSFTISTNVNEGGSVSPLEDSVVQYHDETVYTIIPDEHHYLYDVLVNDESVTADIVGASYQVTVNNVDQDSELKVIFKPNQWMVKKTTTEGGIISPEGITYVTFFDSTVFSILPDPGYLLDSFFRDDTDITDLVTKENVGYSVGLDSIDEHITLKPIFVLDTFTISATAAFGGTITPDIDSAVTVKDTVVYTISSDEYHYIGEVTINGEDVKSKLNHVEYDYLLTVADVAEDKNIQVTFEPYKSPIYHSHNDGGTILPEGTILATFFDSTVLSIIPDPGYDLDTLYLDDVNITDQVTKIENGYSFGIDSVSEQIELEAIFGIVNYTVTTTSNKWGTITPNIDSIVTVKDTISYIITPEEYYKIDSLLINGIDHSNGLADSGDYYLYSLTEVAEDISLEVIFGPHTFNINTISGFGGTITAIDDTVIVIYDSASFEISPKLGYQVSAATLDGEDIMSLMPDAGGIFTIDSVEKDMTLSVSFAPAVFDVELSYSGCGYIIPAQSYTTTVDDFTYIEMFPDENCNIQVVLNGIDITDSIDYYEESIYLPIKFVSEDINIEFIFSESTSIDNTKQHSFDVYPIPCSNNLNIDFKDNTKSFNLNVVNILGESVITIDSFNGRTLDVSSLSNGIYYLIIDSEGEKYINKFIKK